MGNESAADAGRRRAPLGRQIFIVRELSLVALAICVSLVPAMGPDRHRIALAVLVLVLPWDLAMGVWGHRHDGSLPIVMPFVNQLIGAVFVAIEPLTLVPALLILIADLGLAASMFGRRVALVAASFGTVVLSVAAAWSNANNALIALLGYAIGAVALIVNVGALFDDERAIRHRHQNLIGGVDAIVWSAEPGRAFTYVSDRAKDILGYEPDQWFEPGFWQAHIHPVDRKRTLAADAAVLEGERDRELEYRMLAADGGVVYVRDFVTATNDGRGQQGVMIDVTAQRAIEERVRWYSDLVESIQVALVLVRQTIPNDPSSLVVVAANPATRELTTSAEIVGRRLDDVLPGVAGHDLHPHVAAVVNSREPFDFDDLVIGRREGNAGVERHFAVHAFPVGDDLVGIALDDVTSRQLASEALRRQATHDALTGLPNRVLLNDRLRQAVRHASRDASAVALLMMDLDQFKEVNDALGHHHGDRLLVALSRRLEEVLREADTVARLGGDEFAILLTTDANVGGAVTVARKIAAALDEPFDIDGISIQASASVGIALYPEHGEDPESLAKRADVAMYNAKRSSRPYAVYLADEDRSSVRRITLLGELRRALDYEELVLFHQPAFDVSSGEVTGAESLVRWKHPTHGLMSPDEFIDLAEVSGMIQRLSRWAVQRAIGAAREWNHSDDPEFTPRGVSVNLSVRNLYDPDLARWIGHLLHASEFPPQLLTLEVTESEVMDDPFSAIEALGQLHDLGVQTSIDDFGTGQSSLAYLKHLPIDEIKIDRSFVSGLQDNEADATIVRAIIDLGHDLGLSVVAEGVEDEATFDCLRRFECDRAQGFYLARPLPPAAALDVMRPSTALNTTP